MRTESKKKLALVGVMLLCATFASAIVVPVVLAAVHVPSLFLCHGGHGGDHDGGNGWDDNGNGPDPPGGGPGLD